MSLYEYFKPVVGFEDSYQVGALGTVRAIARAKNQHRPFDPQFADARYAEIVNRKAS